MTFAVFVLTVRVRHFTWLTYAVLLHYDKCLSNFNWFELSKLWIEFLDFQNTKDKQGLTHNYTYYVSTQAKGLNQMNVNTKLLLVAVVSNVCE